MKPEIKKLLILNLPYLLFVWLFDKAVSYTHLLTPAFEGSNPAGPASESRFPFIKKELGFFFSPTF